MDKSNREQRNSLHEMRIGPHGYHSYVLLEAVLTSLL